MKHLIWKCLFWTRSASPLQGFPQFWQATGPPLLPCFCFCFCCSRGLWTACCWNTGGGTYRDTDKEILDYTVVDIICKYCFWSNTPNIWQITAYKVDKIQDDLFNFYEPFIHILYLYLMSNKHLKILCAMSDFIAKIETVLWSKNIQLDTPNVTQRYKYNVLICFSLFSVSTLKQVCYFHNLLAGRIVFLLSSLLSHLLCWAIWGRTIECFKSSNKSY